MTKEQVKTRIEEIGIVPAIRAFSAADALFAAEAVFAGGIPVAEVTMTIPGAIEVISNLAKNNPSLIVGAGSVGDLETAKQCVAVGAHFLTSTGLDLEVVDFAGRQSIGVFPGVLTPTEVMTAWKHGADFIKIFPCAQVGGASYIRALRAPFPHIPLIASGGVNQQTAADFILAGAVAVGIGGALIPREAIERRQDHWICELARRFLAMIKEARGQRNDRRQLVNG
jgi:2-dehydro-3-deoxyphosphogluconate aldolase / (4S)-4-hydroxy-2-oxoglutarate aldolase